MTTKNTNPTSPTNKPKKKIGRPTKFTEAIKNEILVRLRNGESATQICNDAHIPQWNNLAILLTRDAIFQQEYARARSDGMHKWADEIVQIAKNETRDYQTVTIFDGKGNVRKTYVQSDNTAVNRDRLKVDTMRWLMAKLAPKVYGEKVIQEITGADGGPVQYHQTVDRPRQESVEDWQARVTKELTDKSKAKTGPIVH